MSPAGGSDPGPANGARRLTRRAVLRAGGGLVAVAATSPYGRLLAPASAASIRTPGSLPDPSRPAGTATAALPFDHLVVVMMENHSFDDHLGMLARRGQPAADGFSFDAHGHPVNSNPLKGGHIVVRRARSLCTPDGGGSQSWNDTHHQIDAGRMDGFARTGEASMTYWDEADLPFYYSLAKTFCLANRWFCSAPCQTYPNRRFLLAGTAFGLISTDTSKIFQDPPNGTIVDRLDAHGISWRDYFTDVPATGVIASIPEKHPANMAPIDQFYTDCAAGALPAVSFVDSDIGVAPVAAGETPAPFSGQAQPLSDQNQDEESGDLSLGENFVSEVVNAVLRSPSWPRIALVWLYDEHGGLYDHVPPPAALAPDSIPPKLGPHDVPGGYDIYGPRVPAAVVSGHARPHSTTNVVHDHTSVLATIESKWNLPAMTYRDANATTLADFLDASVRFPEPPTLAAPSDISRSEQTCTQEEPTFVVYPGPGTLLVRLRPRHRHRQLVVTLDLTRGSLDGVHVELRHEHHLVASARIGHLAGAPRHVVLRAPHHRSLRGRYTLVVRHAHRTLLRRRVHLGGARTDVQVALASGPA